VSRAPFQAAVRHAPYRTPLDGDYRGLIPDSAVRLKGTAKPQESEKNGIHRRGTEYAEILISKNSLRVLRASVVNILLFWKSKTYNNQR
jgi:hypothetical protein